MATCTCGTHIADGELACGVCGRARPVDDGPTVVLGPTSSPAPGQVPVVEVVPAQGPWTWPGTAPPAPGQAGSSIPPPTVPFLPPTAPPPPTSPAPPTVAASPPPPRAGSRASSYVLGGIVVVLVLVVGALTVVLVTRDDGGESTERSGGADASVAADDPPDPTEAPDTAPPTSASTSTTSTTTTTTPPTTTPPTTTPPTTAPPTTAAPAPTAPLPATTDLAATLDGYLAALDAGDVDAAYSYVAPSLRTQEGWDLERFERFAREVIVGAELVTVVSATPATGEVAATVDFFLPDGAISRESIAARFADVGGQGLLLVAYEVIATTRIE